MKCKLCHSDKVESFYKDKNREYLLCPECELIAVPEKYYLDMHSERKRYELHDNTIDNTGYVAYLEAVVSVIRQNKNKDISIIDFGSGKNRVLESLLKREGYTNCRSYDPLYGYMVDFEKTTFDIVVLCEVIEHLQDLSSELSHIKKTLRDNSRLIIRTQVYLEKEQFPKWWYKEDLTHINFFSERTIEFVAGVIGCGTVPIERFKDVFVVAK